MPWRSDEWAHSAPLFTWCGSKKKQCYIQFCWTNKRTITMFWLSWNSLGTPGWPWTQSSSCCLLSARIKALHSLAQPKIEEDSGCQGLWCWVVVVKGQHIGWSWWKFAPPPEDLNLPAVSIVSFSHSQLPVVLASGVFCPGWGKGDSLLSLE